MITIWAFEFKKDTEILRHVQKKATNLMKDLETKFYEGLRDPRFSLEKRQLRGEFITL